MTAPAYCVLEGTTGILPRWPAGDCEDMGGLQFQDDANDPPRPNEHLSSLDFKQLELLVQRLLRMIPALSVDVTLSSSAQTVNAKQCVSDIIVNYVSGVTLAQTGTGTYTLTFLTGRIPPRKLRPRIVGLSMASDPLATAQATQSGNVVTISVYNSAGSLSAASVTMSIDVFGEA